MLYLVGAQVGPWASRARCAELGIPTDEFFEEATDRARQACDECPVRLACLEHALANHEKGYWGGTTGRERWKIGYRRRHNGSN